MEYIIYADESAKEGPYYSNFYGGALVRSVHLADVQEVLKASRIRLGFGAEIKWQKVTAQYLEKYKSLMDEFFVLVAQDRIKIRIMFTQNVNVATNLLRDQLENQYFLLYYQFLKHAFGLPYSNTGQSSVNCRLYLDKLPDTHEKIARFKSFLSALTHSPEFRRAGITVKEDQIAEVVSHDHVILQCLDVVLGAMQFRLNEGHKRLPTGAQRRGKRTVAKEALFKHVSNKIRSIYPNFNIGISTGTGGNTANRWAHPYRHWLFVPAEHQKDWSKAK